jgi:voltage-gated potassium channel
LKKLRIAFTLLIITILFGVVGYYFLEGMSLFDAFYMTIITISTVGFEELKPLSLYGRIVTILIISTGITIGAYTIGTLLRMLIEGELRKSFGRRKVEKKISALKNHYIICGYGRIGSLICRELLKQEINFVVIENDPEMIAELEDERILYLPEDATNDDSLNKAGLENARGLVTAVKSDADNVFITLSAKGIRPDLFIVARASDEKNESKLKRAGATRVVSPYLIGGRRMAQVLIRPTVVDFIDIAMMEGSFGLRMEEARVTPQSHLVGKNLIESNLRKDYGVIIVLIKKNNGEMIFNPQPTEVLDSNDVIVVLGKTEDTKRMNEEI